MEFLKLEVCGTVDDYRTALFRGVLVVRYIPTVSNERKIIMAAAKLCPGVFIEGDKVIANISVNGYDALVMKYRALSNTLKDWVTQTRTHTATHEALGI